MLEIITETTNGKWRLSFEEAAPHQMQKKTIWQATMKFVDREEEDDQQEAVDLGPRGEERDLVAQAEQSEQRQQHPDRDRIEPPGSTPPPAPRPRSAGRAREASTPA